MPYFDLVMPAVSFAQGFGRFGCFFAGCCYGRETDSWFSITFTHSDFAPNGVKLLPTQLMSSAGDFLICGLLLLYAGRKPKEGQVAAGYMVLYGIGRFIIEFFRIQGIKIMQFRIFQNLRMKIGNAVDTV